MRKTFWPVLSSAIAAAVSSTRQLLAKRRVLPSAIPLRRRTPALAARPHTAVQRPQADLRSQGALRSPLLHRESALAQLRRPHEWIKAQDDAYSVESGQMYVTLATASTRESGHRHARSGKRCGQFSECGVHPTHRNAELFEVTASHLCCAVHGFLAGAVLQLSFRAWRACVVAMRPPASLDATGRTSLVRVRSPGS